MDSPNISSLPLADQQCYVLFDPELNLTAVFHHTYPSSIPQEDPLTLLQNWLVYPSSRHLSIRETQHGTAIIQHEGTPCEKLLGYYRITAANPKKFTIADRGFC